MLQKSEDRPLPTPRMRPLNTPPKSSIQSDMSSCASSTGSLNSTFRAHNVDGSPAPKKQPVETLPMITFDQIYTLGRNLTTNSSAKAKVFEASVAEDNNPVGPRGTKVAVKAVNIRNHEKAGVNLVRWELKGLEKAGGHPNVLHGYESVIERKPGEPDTTGFLVTELCNADLYHVSERKLPYEVVVHLFKQMTAGLKHAHSRGICHRDVKVENFFVTHPSSVPLDAVANPAYKDKFTVKIGDFGFWCRSHDENGRVLLHHTNCGSDVYSPAEQALPHLAKKGYDGQKADIFSLGVCLYVLFCGHPPWNCSRSIDDPYYALWVKGHVKQYWSVIDQHTPNGEHRCPAFRELVTRMMSMDPNRRPSIEEVLAHPFVTDVNRKQVTFTCTNKEVSSELAEDTVNALLLRQRQDQARTLKLPIRDAPVQAAAP